MNRQAAFFRALADHYALHPDLAPVNAHPGVYGARPRCQILAPGSYEQALRAWAVSVGADRFRVERASDLDDDSVWLHIDTTLGDVEVEVFGPADWLEDFSYVSGDVIEWAEGAA